MLMPRYIRTHTKEKSSHISNIVSAIWFFISKNRPTQTVILLSTLESTNFDESIKCASRWFTLAQRMQNMADKFANLKCATNTPVWGPIGLE